MEVWQSGDAAQFLGRAGAVLEREEAENNLVLGRAVRMDQNGEPGWFALASQDGEVRGACLRQGADGGVVLSRADDAAARLLADHLPGPPPPWFLAPRAPAEAFAARCGARHDLRPRTVRRMILHRLDSLTEPPPAPGAMRVATTADVPRVQDWTGAFAEEVGHAHLPSAEVPAVGEGRMFLWELDPAAGPVAMAAWSRRTANCVNIGLVFTAPAARGRGFAGQLVARLSQRLLDDGLRCCVLFTDAANPVSNRVYRRIGYGPIGEYCELVFD